MTKPYQIDKHVVWDAYKRIKANHGTYGIDHESIEDFSKDLKGNLYKIWNRMSSGSYTPPPVRRVEIAKGDGRVRPLGIPTVGDRIAQMVAKIYLEPSCEPYFHKDSYAYRPDRSAHDAVATARKRCGENNWVVDLDIKGFFDTIDHSLLEKAVARHTSSAWLKLYIGRWLKAPVKLSDGTLERRNVGTPQGSVISPLLSNLFLHYTFDRWMELRFGHIPFERYADDIIVHCKTYAQAQMILKAIRERFDSCKLQLHPQKTKVVYCRDIRRKEKYHQVSFDFLGFSFKPRTLRRRNGGWVQLFTPGTSLKARTEMIAGIREFDLCNRTNETIADIAEKVNPVVRGWINYYGCYGGQALAYVFYHLNQRLIQWAKRRYKKLKRSFKRAERFIQRIARSNQGLFAHWKFGNSFGFAP